MKWPPQIDDDLCKIFFSATTFFCQHALTLMSEKGDSGYHLPREILSWNRAGIICLERGISSWMSTGLVKHGPAFSFYFPQWAVKHFLTDGGCLTCCHNKINPIPCKTSLFDFIFPDGERKEYISEISETIYLLLLVVQRHQGLQCISKYMYILLNVYMIKNFTCQYFGIYVKIRF